MNGRRRIMHLRTCTCAPAQKSAFDAELHDAAVFGAGNLTEWRRADGAVRLAEARLVPDVEAFDAHLDAMVSGKIEVLEHRQIRPLESGPRTVLRPALPGARRFPPASDAEAGGVEPLRGGLRAVVGIAGRVGRDVM